MASYIPKYSAPLHNDEDYPICLLPDSVERLAKESETCEANGERILLEEFGRRLPREEVCTIDRIKDMLSLDFHPEFVQGVEAYYLRFKVFGKDPILMKNFMDWYFDVRGVTLEEVVSYIVSQAFNFDGVETGDSSQKEGVEDGTSVGECKESDIGGDGGNRGWQYHSGLLNFQPTKIQFNHHLPEEEVNAQRSNQHLLGELLKEAAVNYAEGINAKVSDSLKHCVNVYDSTQPGFGLLYHATSEYALFSIRAVGVQPFYHPNYLASSQIFYTTNSLPEAILYSLLKNPRLSVTRDLVAVLAFKVELSVIQDVPGRQSWVVLDLKDESLPNLTDIVEENMKQNKQIQRVGKEERGVDLKLTGKVALVDVVVGPWSIERHQKEYKIEEDQTPVGVKTLQFGFCSPRSFLYLNEALHMVFLKDWDSEETAAGQRATSA